MAPEESKSKKRKGPTDAAPKSKKLKKSDAATVATKKTSKALKSAVEPIDSVPTNAKVPKASRKRAVDYLSDNDAAAVKDDTVKEKKSKKSKKARLGIEANGDAHVPKEVEEEAVDAKAKPKKTKKKVQALQAALEEPNEKLKKSKKVKKDDAADLEQGLTVKKVKSKKSKLNVEEEQDYDEDDDQTAALLAGFESSGDEEDPEDDTGLATENPKATITPTMRLELEEANKNEDQPGVVYVGRIPHGFYEHQMKGYFSQFGTVTRLRLSRNKRTGHPKHYAFVEFASAEVADIVSQTMDNYLLFGHILQCRLVPSAQVHPNLFKDAGKRFKPMPRNKIVGAQMKRGVEREYWKTRIENEEKRRESKHEELLSKFGYDFEAPKLRSVDDVPQQALLIEDAPSAQLLVETQKSLDAVSRDEAGPESKPKASINQKKPKADKDLPDSDTIVVAGAIQEAVPSEKPKVKKVKKSKAKAVPDASVEVENASVEIVKEKKGKKDKKGKKGKTNIEAETVQKEEKLLPDGGVQVKVKKSKKDAKASNKGDAVTKESKAKKKSK